MRLIVELTDGDGLEQAVRDLLEWHEIRTLRSGGEFILVGCPSATGAGLSEYQFRWRITGLTAEETNEAGESRG